MKSTTVKSDEILKYSTLNFKPCKIRHVANPGYSVEESSLKWSEI